MSIYSNNRTLLREESYKETFYKKNILEVMIDATTTDFDVFESVIGNDFYHAFSESGVLAVTEAEKEAKDTSLKLGIIDKIKLLIKNAIEAIRSFFGKFLDKLEEVTDKDIRLWKKYGDAVTKNGVGKKIKTKYAAFCNLSDQDEEYNKFLQDETIFTICNNAIEKARGAIPNTDKIASIYDEAIKSMEQTKDDMGKFMGKISQVSDTEIEGTLDANDIATFRYYIRGTKSKTIDSIKANNKKAISELENIIKQNKFDNSVEGSKNTQAYYSETESFISKTVKIITEMQSLQVKAFTKIYSIVRSLFISAGKICTEKSANNTEENKSKEKTSEEAKQESVEMWALMELSDMYIEEAFSF